MSTLTRRERANAIRFLAIDAVQKANSGHPGMPMGMADIAEVLWHDFMQHNPQNPQWTNRDRFVVSNGHGCMLLYALLHLSGYALSIEDIKQFRQLHSKTPGHPEFGETPGVETTTGPLGQGLANAVGMAVAAQHMAAVFNRPNFPIVDHYTYCFVGDGCLMEGISHEVASLAGAMSLGKLIVFYDDNGISIDGDVAPWFSDNTPKRFEAYNWHVIPKVDGHDPEALRAAILEAQKETNKPTIICCKTTIGYGSPNKAGTADTHGAALGDEEVAAARAHLGWNHAPFELPAEIYAEWDARARGAESESAWDVMFANYAKQHPELAREFTRRVSGQLPDGWSHAAKEVLVGMQEKKQNVATRKASQLCLDQYAEMLPEMVGGSADLTESNCTIWKNATIFSKNAPNGRYIHYGVREFGMSAMMNGMALYKGVIPFGGTFLTFADYARNALRLASIMKQRVIFVYTHDSIGLGEDGPTHQPVEQLPSLRIMPGLSIWRPCDTVETAAAWAAAIERSGPTCLLFSRQALACWDRNAEQLDNVARGGYVLQDAANHNPDVILIATGSEVTLAMDAAKQLKAANIGVRVVSMPSTDVFMAQDAAYRESVLPSDVKARVVIEAAASAFWYSFVGDYGKVLGLDRYGASAPAKDVFRECGFTVEQVVAMAKEVIYSAANALHQFQPRCINN